MLTPLLLLATFTAVQGQQGSCNINRLVAPLNAACCPNARSCSGGIPTVCTTACRTAWTDFSESPCRAQVLSTTGTDASSMRLASIFTSVGQLCGRSDGRPGAGGVCPSLDAPAGTTGECRDTNLGATCDFACGGDQTGHRRAQTGGVATFSCGPGRGGPEWTQTASCADGAVAAVGLDPSDSTQFIMNNGQTMPVVSFGFEIYGNDEASELMGIALDAGVRNFFASVLASNQPGVGSKINTMEREHGVTREEIFLCGSVTQCRTNLDDDACYQYTADMAARNLRDLDVDYLDQIMLDYPPSANCDANTCMLIKAQWRAFTDMLERGETLSIAVSNYCPCHLDCIIDDPDLSVVPVVNQLKCVSFRPSMPSATLPACMPACLCCDSSTSVWLTVCLSNCLAA
jgi:diketogulonate reductase-like aldo/keto reductase